MSEPEIVRPFELPNRRFSIVENWRAALDNAEWALEFCYGFDAAGRVREVFCNGFHTGTDLERHARVMCIDISHALQYGSSVNSLATAFRKIPEKDNTLHALMREIILRGVSVERAHGAEAREIVEATVKAKKPRELSDSEVRT